MPSQNWMCACGSFALGLRTVGGGGVEPENVEAKTPRQPHRAGKSLVNS